jgi:GTP cyclohydrolase II
MSGSHLPIEKLLDTQRFRDAHDGSVEAGATQEPRVEIASIADLPTRFGDFHIVAFWNNRDGKDHVALVRGDVVGARDVPVRLHSECLTGDALGSLRCDCRDQLEAALKAIGQMECGIILYLRQEGRGIGLLNKIRAYGLQDYGYDTVEANLALGFRDDERDYAVAAQMLRALQVQSIQLMTNNPKKIEGLAKHGVVITGRIPHVMPSNPHNEAYLRTKVEKSGHLIALPGIGHQNEPHTGTPIKGTSMRAPGQKKSRAPLNTRVQTKRVREA